MKTIVARTLQTTETTAAVAAATAAAFETVGSQQAMPTAIA
jgi:hypothetical protein